MCGIIAVFSNEAVKQTIKGLKNLQNRGYDSAGIVWVNNNSFKSIKYASTPQEDGIEKLEKEVNKLDFTNINVCVGHTRWATHGAKTDHNSHPHISMNKKIAVVHNGIVENYKELKNKLTQQGYCFESNTDTEVLANFIENVYLNSENKSLKDILSDLPKNITGTWGLGVYLLDKPNKVYFTKHGSPLIYYYSDNMAICSSEISGFDNKFSNYFMVDEDEVISMEFNDENQIQVESKSKPLFKVSEDFITPESSDPYPHWMLKEIFEQPESVQRSLNYGGRLENSHQVKLGGLDKHRLELIDCNNLILFGCGTSYFAADYAKTFFKEISGFDTVQIFDGAEFSNLDIPKKGSSCAIFFSQSGETRDLFRCIDICEENNIVMIGAINVVDSMIARKMLCGVYLNAGPEIAVASTKSFTSQVIVATLISIWFSQNRDINKLKREIIIKDLHKLSKDIGRTINNNESINKSVQILNKQSLFVLGKGSAESIAKEGSLKIKEVTYIHSEAYSSSSLKHGPYSLLTENIPVVLIKPNNKHKIKNNSVYEEIKSRNSPIVVIGNDLDCDIVVPYNETFNDLLCVYPLQVIAYKIGIDKGINVDKPRNLAKCVTTD